MDVPEATNFSAVQDVLFPWLGVDASKTAVGRDRTQFPNAGLGSLVRAVTLPALSRLSEAQNVMTHSRKVALSIEHIIRHMLELD